MKITHGFMDLHTYRALRLKKKKKRNSNSVRTGLYMHSRSLLRVLLPARCAIPYKAVGAVIVSRQQASLSKGDVHRARFPRAGFLYIRAQSTTRKVARLGSEQAFSRAWFLRLGSHRPTGMSFTML